MLATTLLALATTTLAAAIPSHATFLHPQANSTTCLTAAPLLSLAACTSSSTLTLSPARDGSIYLRFADTGACVTVLPAGEAVAWGCAELEEQRWVVDRGSVRYAAGGCLEVRAEGVGVGECVEGKVEQRWGVGPEVEGEVADEVLFVTQ